MPHCKTCQISSPFHELIDGLCHKCTARELKRLQAATESIRNKVLNTVSLLDHVPVQFLKAISIIFDTELYGVSNPEPTLTPEKFQQLVEDVRKLHTPGA